MQNLKRLALLVIVQFILIPGVRADEGMWLPMYINKIIGNMQGYGCRLTADQVYSMNQSSVKDGIVHFGGFCTGEIVSDKGLIFTNHHCGYEAIASLSNVTDNYLDDGYWANSANDEIPVPGLTASFLVYMQDVTDRVRNASDKDAEMKKIIQEATAGNHYTAKVESMFYGAEYYLMVHEVFTDIRFVGAPPSSVGKFGGDTDNWMWPRHTGDFSVFRIYAGPDNKPAEYSATNQPYKPKYYFPINLKGVQPNDFVMIMGYPGRTTRYLPKSSIESLTLVDYPQKVDILTEKLARWDEEMDKSDNVRLMLASNYARYANAWKYYQGVMDAIQHSPCLSEKTAFEEGFAAWVRSSNDNQSKYGNLLAQFEQLESSNKDIIIFTQYLNYAYFAPKITELGTGFVQLNTLLGNKTKDQDAINGEIEKLKAGTDAYFAEFISMADQKVFASMLRLISQKLPEKFWVKTLTRKEMGNLKLKDAVGDKFDIYAAYTYQKSILTDSARFANFMAKPSKKVLDSDLGIQYCLDVMELITQYRGEIINVRNQRNELMTTYMAAIREYKSNEFFYPDANSTLRLTYGKVGGMEPRDGMTYTWYSSHKGILEKEIPGDDEFDVRADLKKLLVEKDFGKYAMNGELPVNFLANLDITGGNSGSPVINGNGELVGIAFDGIWEGMVGDIYFDENRNRTISVDIRYVIFIIDKMGKCDRVIKELKLIY